MNNSLGKKVVTWKQVLNGTIALLAVALTIVALPQHAAAQDQDDPPSRVARLGYTEGSVSFQPAGESEWVQAVPNRPMTTGDQLWADRDSRAEVQLGSASIRLAANTGFSFLNLDDRTVQIQLSSGTINVSVRELDRDDVFEIDTPNQAFTIFLPGRYRVEASEDGTYTVVTIREGEGESTGNGQTYTLHAGQRTTFSGSDELNAEVQPLGGQDDFDNWSYGRERRYDDSPSAKYCSRDMVGFEDLDEYGDWRPHPQYGNVWFPRVAVGWAPYHQGHWAWIDPWGWTWVDDDPWGYAPFHYGRWAAIEGRWGWIPGPIAVRPVYAPALVVFVGGGGIAVGGNVAWFPLGPREVYVPSYRVSPGYVNRVNITNTTVNQTTITNVYNTTIINKNTTITNVTYVNRNVQGAVTAVPQRTFTSAQPVARAAVVMNSRDIASASVSSRAAVAPSQNSVLGAHANTANRVAAPPQAVARRPVIARTAPPPAAASFAVRQQVLDAHPGQPVARQEMQRMRPAGAPAPQSQVRQAPPGKPATATPAINRPGNQPANAPANQPANPAGNRRPGNPPPGNERPGATPPQPNRPEPNRPQPSQSVPNTRPEPNRPEPNRPAQPPVNNDRPPSAQPNRPEPNRPTEPPVRNDRAPSSQPNRPQPTPPPPNNRPETSRPEPNRPSEPPVRHDRPSSTPPNNRPETSRPQPTPPAPNNRPEATRPPEQPRNQPAPRPQNPPPNDRPPQRTPPAETRPAPRSPQQQQPPKPQTPEEKKRQDEQLKEEQRRKDEKPQPPGL